MRDAKKQALQWVPPLACLVVALIAIANIGWAPISDIGTSDIEDFAVEGDKGYIPSRLDWMSLTANATLAKNEWKSEGFIIYFASAGKGTNTIAILGVYHPERIKREQLNKEIEFARQSLEVLAKSKGWDDWLKIHEKVQARN